MCCFIGAVCFQCVPLFSLFSLCLCFMVFVLGWWGAIMPYSALKINPAGLWCESRAPLPSSYSIALNRVLWLSPISLSRALFLSFSLNFTRYESITIQRGNPTPEKTKKQNTKRINKTLKRV